MVSRPYDRPNTFAVVSEEEHPQPEAEHPHEHENVVRSPRLKPPVRPRDPNIYQRNRIVCNLEHAPEVDLFRMLAAQIVTWLEERNGHAIAITSCGEGEGKTLMAVNLAICLAKNSAYESVLVDADLRRPNVSRSLGIDVEIGLEHVLAGNASLDDCMLVSEIEGLLILPTKSVVDASSRLLSTGPLTKLAGDIQATNKDRLVLYDLPPVLLGDSCAPFLKAADGCLMVVEEGHTTRTHLQRALSLIKQEKVIGVLLNKASDRMAQQYGYFSYDYYNGKK